MDAQLAAGTLPDETPIDVEALFRRYGPMVLRRCRGLLRDEQGALDAAQDVFVRLLSAKKRLHGRYPSALLYRMATNVSLNALRAQRRRIWHADSERIEVLPCGENFEEELVERETLHQVFRRESALTVHMARLHYAERYTLRETAQRVGLSVSGVRKRLRGLRRRGLAVLTD